MQAASQTFRAGPKIYRHTVEEFDRMAGAGFFRRRRVELLEGRIILMAPQYEPHVAAVSLVARALERAFGDGYWVRRQSPIRLGARSKPEPDVAVVRGSEDDYLDSGAPTDPLLLVEISDSTLAYDRGRKASAYAKHVVSDYWILNPVDRQLEVYRQPAADVSARFGYRYGSIAVLRTGNSIAPLANPSAVLAVADMLPRTPALQVP